MSPRHIRLGFFIVSGRPKEGEEFEKIPLVGLRALERFQQEAGPARERQGVDGQLRYGTSSRPAHTIKNPLPGTSVRRGHQHERRLATTYTARLPARRCIHRSAPLERAAAP
jgi:hypothetical protein